MTDEPVLTEAELRLLGVAVAEAQACGHCDGTCGSCREEVAALRPVIESILAARSQPEPTIAATAVAISNLLNASYAPGTDPELILWRRLTKVSEEAGEVQNALRGWVGENPRKGVTHTQDDVINELLDCAGAALGGVAHLTGDASGVQRLADRLLFVHARLIEASRRDEAIRKAQECIPGASGCRYPGTAHATHVWPCPQAPERERPAYEVRLTAEDA